MSEKDRLRMRMRAARAEQSPAVGALRSANICKQIEREPAYGNAGVLAAYIAIGGEADPALLMRRAHQAGRRVAVPRVEEGGVLSLREWTPDAPLVVGPMGLSEPAVDATVVELSTVEFVIVPGLAFDLHGGRLGFGKGYYDRMLHHTAAALRIGMAFSIQLVPRVPTEDHDLPMDRVATEDALHVCQPGAAPTT